MGYEARKHRPARASASDDRVRAYSLVLAAYSEVRRATSHVRWHQGDAESFAPSLWTGRGGRGKPKEVVRQQAERDARRDAADTGR